MKETIAILGLMMFLLVFFYFISVGVFSFIVFLINAGGIDFNFNVWIGGGILYLLFIFFK